MSVEETSCEDKQLAVFDDKNTKKTYGFKSWLWCERRNSRQRVLNVIRDERSQLLTARPERETIQSRLILIYQQM